jgi:hypothetical protein
MAQTSGSEQQAAFTRRINISLRQLQGEPEPGGWFERIPNPSLQQRRILGQRSKDPVHSVDIKATGRIHHPRGLKQTPSGQETVLQALVLMIDQGSRG